MKASIPAVAVSNDYKRLTYSLTLYSISPAIAVNQDSIHVVWDDESPNTNQYVCYRRSLDNGDTWEDVVKRWR